MMITVNSDNSVVLTIDGKDYRIEDDGSYRDLVVYLTNPDPDVHFPEGAFEVDPTLQDDVKIGIADRYSTFFKDYSARRDIRLEEKTSAIREGMLARDEAVASLASSANDVSEVV